MATALVIVLGIYAAVMTYLRATASKTDTKVDDKLLAAGEAVEPVIEFLETKVPKAPETK
jgi:hypothetical protein